MVHVEVHREGDELVILSDSARILRGKNAVLMTNVKVVEDSDGAILVGELFETAPAPARIGREFRRARWDRRGKIVDTSNQRVVRSTPGAIVTPNSVHYVGK